MLSNIDTITALYEHFAKKDNESIRQLFDDAIEWTQMEGFPNGGQYVGADEIFAKVFQGFRDNWVEWKAVVTEYISAEDSVFAIGYYEGVYGATKKQVKADFVHRYMLSGGKVVRFQQYTDTYLIAQTMGIATLQHTTIERPK